MLHKSGSLRYYMFSVSNLMAAFGGGLILGKCSKIINIPFLQGGSILAFFIGTILGLIFLQVIPKRLSQSIAQTFSISAGITSLILFYIYQHYASDDKLTGLVAIIFFLVLSIRFGFWFYSRVMRASITSSQQKSIAWVEFGYYIGMVLGLVIWKILGINIALSSALIIDAVCQIIAGIMDLKSYAIKVDSGDQTPESNLPSFSKGTQLSSLWCWRMASAVIFITIGIQVVIFNMAHYTTEVYSTYILATFYSGVALAAYLSNRYKIYLSWDKRKDTAYILVKNSKIKSSFLCLILLSALALFMVIYSIHSLLMLCVFVFIAAIIFEILSIALLDRLGLEEKQLDKSGMIMRTYGLMGLGAAISLWVLSLFNGHINSSIVLFSICLLSAIALISKRSLMTDYSSITYFEGDLSEN